MLEIMESVLRMVTPLVLAGLGEMIIEKAGILNLGIEGTMVFGAFIGFLVSYFTGWPLLGLLLSATSGMLLAFLMGWLVVSQGRSQHLSGLGVTLLATELAAYTYRLALGTPEGPPKIITFSRFPLPGVFHQYGLTYLAFGLVILTHWVLKNTAFGLRLRVAGENPESLDLSGVNVQRIRYTALVIGGGLMGAGGAFWSLASPGYYLETIVAGRGWVCLCLVIFSNWKPLGILGGALLFVLFEALQIRVKALGIPVQQEAFNALPFLATLLTLVFLKRRRAPAALLKPFPEKD